MTLLATRILTSASRPLYFGLTGWISGSVNQIGWAEVLWMTIPGILLGYGIAKTGFGTECSVMAPEATFTKESFYLQGGVPQCTYRMFRAMLPLQGFMVAIVTFNLFILAWWLLGFGTVPNAAGQAGLYWGDILGGPLLAMGAVFMIGIQVMSFRAAHSFLDLKVKEIITHNTDEIMYIAHPAQVTPGLSAASQAAG